MSWQTCPKCDGEGTVPKKVMVFNRPLSKPLQFGNFFGAYQDPPALEERINGVETCGVCKGKQIINAETGLPPGHTPEYSVDTSRLLCSKTLKGLRFEGRFK
jgi:hypothetical protein